MCSSRVPALRTWHDVVADCGAESKSRHAQETSSLRSLPAVLPENRLPNLIAPESEAAASNQWGQALEQGRKRAFDENELGFYGSEMGFAKSKFVRPHRRLFHSATVSAIPGRSGTRDGFSYFAKQRKLNRRAGGRANAGKHPRKRCRSIRSQNHRCTRQTYA